MWRKSFALVLAAAALVVACSSAKKGESCEDEGTVGGDCEESLLCARKLPDSTSELVCLKYCASDTDCEQNETCSGERGRNLSACRPK